MTTQIPSLAFASLLLASVPPLYLFATSSRLLLQYEDLTKKAAKISSEASHQLRKTRTTQGSAVIASLFSAASAGYVLQICISTVGGGARLQRGDSSWINYVCLANLLSCSLVAKYVSGFWAGALKVPVPGAREYNDAVKDTQKGTGWLYRLGVGWGVVYVGRALIGFVNRQ